MPPSPLRAAVVDYGFGNLRSVARALERSGVRPEICGDPTSVRRADAVVLPGVGDFADARASLREKGLDAGVLRAIEDGRPYLGLCLGLQLLFDEGDEHGPTPGFGLVHGRVERFPERDAEERALRVPHIGWNTVRFSGSHPVVRALPEEDCFYFVHSYRALAAEPAWLAGETDYGGPFAAAVARENILAVQFHPEKSQGAGRRVLDAFAAWAASC